MGATQSKSKWRQPDSHHPAALIKHLARSKSPSRSQLAVSSPALFQLQVRDRTTDNSRRLDRKHNTQTKPKKTDDSISTLRWADYIQRDKSVEDAEQSLPDSPGFFTPVHVDSTFSSQLSTSNDSALFSIDASTPSSLSSVATGTQYKESPVTLTVPALPSNASQQSLGHPVVGFNVETSVYEDEQHENEIKLLQKVEKAQHTIQGVGMPVDIDQGFAELLQLAKKSPHAKIFYLLGECYYNGTVENRQADYEKAFQYFEKAVNNAVENNCALVAQAQYRMARMLLKGKGASANKVKAFHQFKLAAQKGHIYAQFMVGRIYEQLQQDWNQARHWYSLAAEQGHLAVAQASLGSLLIDHLETFTQTMLAPVSRDDIIQSAIKILQLAADQNNSCAILRLAALFAKGDIVSQDIPLSLQYYERAALVITEPDDYRIVHYNIGLTYYNGDAGVVQDYAKAIKHLDLAQQAGYAPAQCTLGHIYNNGTAVTKNQQLAYILFQKAFEQGSVDATCALGEQYQHGRGCQLDRTKALDMYRSAFEAGSFHGEYLLAMLLHADQDYPHAYSHFKHVAGTDTPEEFPQDSALTRTKAQIMVCLYHFNGWGNVTKEPASVFDDLICLSNRTATTLTDAHYWIGMGYREGVKDTNGTMVVKPDMTRALHYFERGAKLGDLSAQLAAAELLSGRAMSGTSMYKEMAGKDTTRAFIWYESAAKQGHQAALHFLGFYYAKGIQPVRAVDQSRAISLFEKAAQQGYTPSMLSLAQQLLRKDDTPNPNKNQMKEDHAKAKTWLTRASNLPNTDPAVFRELASVYEAGLCIENQDNPDARYTAARKYLQKAIDMGDKKAWCDLARYYENGWSVDVDFEKALACIEKAKQQGYTKACLAKAELYERRYLWNDALNEYNHIAQEYSLHSRIGWKARLAKCRQVASRGRGDKNDRIEVASWLHFMVEQEGSECLIEPYTLLGVCYELGIGVTEDKERAMHYYEEAVHQTTHGLNWPQASARVRLVKLYAPWRPAAAFQQCQILVPLLNDMNRQSPELALQARQVRYYLGYLTLHGLGTTQNEKEAHRWLAQAADEGDGLAAYELGMLADRRGDEPECRRRLEQGVCANDVGSMRELALLLRRDNRDDIMWDGEDAYQYLKHAALDLGDLEALVQLGLAHEYGLGTRTPAGNPARALMYYKAAADGGHVKAPIYAGEACHRLGLHGEAIEWFQKTRDHPTSRMRLLIYGLWDLIPKETDPDLKVDLVQLETLVHNLIMQDKAMNKNTEDEKRLRRSTIGNGCYEIGMCYEKGLGATVNDSEAKMWYQRAVELAEHVEAMVRLGALLVQESDYEGAFESYEHAATHKHSEALYMVGLYHWQQMGSMEKKPAVARKYFEKAIQQGHTKAMFTLGHILWHEESRHREGFALYKSAADLQMKEACREIGNLYHEGFKSETGFAVRHDHNQAYDYYLRGAHLGDGMSALMVGSYFEKGYGDAQVVDHEQALAWYAEAERMGCGPLAELAMGVALHNQERFEEAFNYFVRASDGNDDSSDDHDTHDNEQGLAHAKVMVALYHLHGWGAVQRDEMLGFRLLRDIADQGTSEAFAEVARCYENGIGVQPSPTDALAYWELAAAMDDIEAIERVGDYHKDGLAGRLVDLDRATVYYDRAAFLRNGQLERENSIRSSAASSMDTYAIPE